MMVKRTRLIEVGEINNIRIECRICTNEVVIRLARSESIPDECPMCRCSSWIVGTYADRIIRVLRSALEADDKVKSTIRFEVDGEESEIPPRNT